MLALLVFLINQTWAQTCAQDITRILSKDPVPEVYEKTLKSAELALGKPLTQKQSEALEEVLKKSYGDSYMASELAKQDRILQKAGLDPYDIEILRRKKILSNTVIKLDAQAPTGFHGVKIALQELDKAKLVELKKTGKKYNYLVGENGEIHITADKIDFPKDKVILANNSRSVTGKPNVLLLVREAGELSFDSNRKGVVFKPTHSFENNEFASKAMAQKIQEMDPSLKAKVLSPSNAPQSKVLKCLDIVSSQSSGKNFLLNRLIADNMVFVSSIAVGEVAQGAGRLNSKEGIQLLAGDALGNTTSTIIGSAIGLAMMNSKTSMTTSLAIRSGMSYGGVKLQEAIHHGVTDESANESVDAITNFNMIHAAARIPINQAFDWAVVQKLPNQIFNACQRNPALAVAISPISIRIMERYGSSMAYYGLRDAYIGE